MVPTSEAQMMLGFFVGCYAQACIVEPVSSNSCRIFSKLLQSSKRADGSGYSLSSSRDLIIDEIYRDDNDLSLRYSFMSGLCRNVIFDVFQEGCKGLSCQGGQAISSRGRWLGGSTLMVGRGDVL